jgi:hypothetical protein
MYNCLDESDDEDMTSLDTTIDYMVSSFRYLHINSWYNSLGSTCTCLYLIKGVFQSASSSKSNIRKRRRHHEHDIHPWDPGPSRSMLQECGEHFKNGARRPPPWPPP